MRSAAFLVFEIGYTIAIPAVIFVFGGHWLDVRFDTQPIFTLSGLLISLPVSSYAVWRKLRPYLKQDG